MCSSSYVGDYFLHTFPERYPSLPSPSAWSQLTFAPPEVSKTEFESLKAEVAALRELLTAAKTFDEKTGQKDCETADKVAFLKKIAAFVGIDLKDVI